MINNGNAKFEMARLFSNFSIRCMARKCRVSFDYTCYIYLAEKVSTERLEKEKMLKAKKGRSGGRERGKK